MKLYFFRHAMTAGNESHRYIGSTDDALSEAGIAEARRSGGCERVKTVYVTPLKRTCETAKILFPKAEQIIVDGLREMDFGAFENRSAAEMASDDAYRAWVDGGCEGTCPGGESREDFCERVRSSFAALLPQLKECGEDVVFVVHGGTIMALVSCFARPEMEYYDCAVKNCGGYCVELSEENGEIIFTHLQKLDHVTI